MHHDHDPKVRTRESVREVLARHRDQLIDRYDAVGVGLGKQNIHDEDYVIVVYLAAPRRQSVDDVRVEGVPVVFRVTGRIHPLPRGETTDGK